jgi:hypothetical protein
MVIASAVVFVVLLPKFASSVAVAALILSAANGIAAEAERSFDIRSPDCQLDMGNGRAVLVGGYRGRRVQAHQQHCDASRTQ